MNYSDGLEVANHKRAQLSQPSLRRLKEFGIRPKHDLGQNFLIDSNILGVIGSAADLSDKDVVLEVGGGLGVLSEYLAARARFVHVIEMDRALAPPLQQALDGHKNVLIHIKDVLKLNLSEFDPEPNKLIANLPYGVAATTILRTVQELAGMHLWVGMVQKEVGKRLAAQPGDKLYGAPSVLAQLACDVQVVRPISRRVFHPVPNVDSVLVKLIRRRQPPSDAVWKLVGAAFAHRRKALPKSLSLALDAPPDTRDRAQVALQAIGFSTNARAEELGPQDYYALAQQLNVPRL